MERSGDFLWACVRGEGSGSDVLSKVAVGHWVSGQREHARTLLCGVRRPFDPHILLSKFTAPVRAVSHGALASLSKDFN